MTTTLLGTIFAGIRQGNPGPDPLSGQFNRPFRNRNTLHKQEEDLLLVRCLLHKIRDGGIVYGDELKAASPYSISKTGKLSLALKQIGYFQKKGAAYSLSPRGLAFYNQSVKDKLPDDASIKAAFTEIYQAKKKNQLDTEQHRKIMDELMDGNIHTRSSVTESVAQNMQVGESTISKKIGQLKRGNFLHYPGFGNLQATDSWFPFGRP